MACTEAGKEHIMYTFNGFYKTVLRYVAITAWRDRNRRRQKYPLNTFSFTFSSITHSVKSGKCMGAAGV